MTQKDLTYADQMRADGKFTAVLRLASMSSADAAGMVGHGERKIGNLDHVDPTRSHLNKILIGNTEPDPENPGRVRSTLPKELMAETRDMAKFNHKSNIVGLSKLGRKKDLAAVRRRGPQNPWHTQKKSKGPHREVVLTVHRDFFRADENTPKDRVLQFLDDQGLVARFDLDKVKEFEEAGLGFLKHFAEDLDPKNPLDLRYARLDLDEQSVHFQAFMARRVKVPASKRFAVGKHLYSMTDHAGIGHEINEKGFIAKKGYEKAQDAVGEWFARPEYRHMNIVRGENREEKKRRAREEAKRLEVAAEAAVLLDGDDEIPDGSPNARRMFLLRKAMAEKISEKGSAEKVRKDDRQTLALDYLEALGVISGEQRHEHQSRRAQASLLATVEADYGTAAEIIAEPAAVASKVMAETKARIEAENRAAERARAAADKRAAEERARLDREAAQERKKAADEVAAQRKAADYRDAELDKKASALDKLSKHLGGVRDQLAKARQTIIRAAQKLGLMKSPYVRDMLNLGDEIGIVRDPKRPRIGDDPRD